MATRINSFWRVLAGSLSFFILSMFSSVDYVYIWGIKHNQSGLYLDVTNEVRKHRDEEAEGDVLEIYGDHQISGPPQY